MSRRSATTKKQTNASHRVAGGLFGFGQQYSCITVVKHNVIPRRLAVNLVCESSQLATNICEFGLILRLVTGIFRDPLLCWPKPNGWPKPNEHSLEGLEVVLASWPNVLMKRPLRCGVVFATPGLHSPSVVPLCQSQATHSAVLSRWNSRSSSVIVRIGDFPS